MQYLSLLYGNNAFAKEPMLRLHAYCMSCLALEGAAFFLQNMSMDPQFKKFFIFQETRKFVHVLKTIRRWNLR
jgi:hypothetical protein